MIFDIFKAVLLGCIEGLTEFIPVSSTGHLILFGQLLTLHYIDQVTFDIAIQLGAVLAVVLYYRPIFASWLKPSFFLSRQFVIVALGTVPALIAGLTFYPFIKSLFSPFVVAVSLGIGGIFMLIVDYKKKDTVPTCKSLETLSYKQALAIGLCQCFSLIPGTSRSGSTIVGGLLSGLDHRTAAQYSFILSVPIMLAATSYELLHTFHTLNTASAVVLLVGFLVSFIVALGAIHMFITLISRVKLFPFAVYRIVLSSILIYLLY